MGKTGKTIPAAPSILIILMGSMGDVVRGMGLVAHLKQHLTDCRITWLVEPAWAGLVRTHPLLDQVLVFDRPRGIRGVLQLRRELARLHFDLTLDLQRHFKSGLFSFFSGARRRLGFHRRDAKEFNWLFNNEQIEYAGEGIPKSQHYFMFPAHLGLPEPERFEFGFTDPHQAAELPAAPAGATDAIALVMGSSWPSKDWHWQGYRDLAQEIIDTLGRKVVLVGDRSQVAVAERTTAAVNSARLTNLTGKTTLLELVSTLRAAAAAIGPDSGPGHLAAAAGTPSITLFGPTNPARTAPHNCQHLVVEARRDCAYCYKRQCPTPEDHCLSDIRINDIMAKLKLALNAGVR